MTKKATRSSKPRKKVQAETIAKANHTFQVSGRVLDHKTGQGIPALQVKAFDKDIRSEQFLGTATTDDEGHYEIPYTAEQFDRAEKKSADLIVRVFSAEGLQLSESDVLYNAAAETTIDLNIELDGEQGASEYDHLMAELAALLQNVPIANLRNDDITFLVGETGLDRRYIEFLVQGTILSQETDLPPEVFYGFARQNLPLDLEQLLGRSLDELRTTFVTSIKLNIIPARLSDSLSEIMVRFRKLKHERMTVHELAAEMHLDLPPALLPYLGTHGIHTLVDIRNAGGLSHLEGLPVAQDNPAVRLLEAHAQLSILPTATAINTLLIKAGYTSVNDIAEASYGTFANGLEKQIGQDGSLAIYATAQAQSRYLANAVTELRIDNANGVSSSSSAITETVIPHICGCDDCDNATSPMAYLADLLDYAIRHLEHDGNKVTLTFLQEQFHQPFRDLPVTCELMEKRVRQVRICIEVLRKHLPAAFTAYTPQSYLVTAYTMLLERIGTSFDEIRRARSLKHAQRRALAQRLRIDLQLQHSPPNDPDQLDWLFLDIDPKSPANQIWPLNLTERSLEWLFGLRDTNRSPLDPDAPPAILDWRMGFLRREWYREDWLDKPAAYPLPLIDPNVIGLADIKYVTAATTSKAWELWQERNDLVKKTQIDIVEFIKQLGLDLLLQDKDAQGHSLEEFGLGKSIADLMTLRDHRDNDKADISADLRNLRLSEDAFDSLVSTAELNNNPTIILPSEWDNIASILVQRWKLMLHKDWRTEEEKMGIMLSPDHFQLRPAALSGSELEWHATLWGPNITARQKWEDILTARIEQEQAVINGLQEAVSAVEEELLVELRNELIRTIPPTGYTTAKLNELTDRFQIDMQAGHCEMTTRIAQAIETIQGVLFGARNGLLQDDSLTLDTNNFDEEWKWLGSYATWRAAMEVFLYPENALRPTLRRRQSPAFLLLLQNLRNKEGSVDAVVVQHEANSYAQYFQDVCNLQLQACAKGSSSVLGIPQTLDFTYLLAQSTISGTHYFSYIDPQPANPSDAQSFWEEVPELKTVNRVLGAGCYEPSRHERYLYIFAELVESGKQSLAFIRRNLAYQTKWEKLEPLDLPNSAIAFTDLRIKQTKRQDPPMLSVWLSRTEGYTRSLNVKGNGWESKSAQRIQLQGKWQHLGKANSIYNADFACLVTPQIQAKFSLTGDFDHDGRDEILVAPNRPGTEGNDLWVMKYDALSKGWSHLNPTGHPLGADLDCSGTPFAAKFAIAGDFDGDGQDEVVIALETPPIIITAPNFTHANLFWVKKFDPISRTWGNLGTTTSTIPALILTALLGLPTDIAFRCDFGSPALTPEVRKEMVIVGDFNGDGRDEIAFGANASSKAGSVLSVMGLGSDGIWRTLSTQQCCEGTEDVAANFAIVGDFNNDQRDEIAVAKRRDPPKADATTANDFWVMRLNEGEVLEHLTGFDCSGLQIAARFAIAGDFDGDGSDEIAIAKEPSGGAGSISNGNEFWIANMDANGTWSFLSEMKCSADLTQAKFAIAGDFDGDGFDEIAVARSASAVDGKDFWIADWDPNVSNWKILTELNASGGRASAFKGLVAGHFSEKDSCDQIAVSGDDNSFWAVEYDVLAESGLVPSCLVSDIEPKYLGKYAIEPALTNKDGTELKTLSATAFNDNKSGRLTNLIYIEEAFYFVRIEIALRLRESGNYIASLDWFRSVYDYNQPPGKSKIAYKLILDAGKPDFTRRLNWLRDPLNPHAIGETRKNSYNKFTILAIVRCLLDFADAEFTRATSESVPHARELYLQALELLNAAEIGQRTSECSDLIGKLELEVGSDEEIWVWHEIRRKLGSVTNYQKLVGAVEKLQPILVSSEDLSLHFSAAHKIVEDALDGVAMSSTFATIIVENKKAVRATSAVILSDPIISNTVERLGLGITGSYISDVEDRPTLITQKTSTGIPLDSNNGDHTVFGSFSPEYIPAPLLSFCIPPHRVIQAARSHAELNLHKIRTCRNIAGMDLRLEPYTGQTAALASLQTLGSGDQLPSVQPLNFQPLPYRYATLIERTKQLVDLARQMENSMLSFIASADQEKYQEIKARQDLALTQAGVRLKDMQLTQATDGIVSAELQRDRAQLQTNHYGGLLKAGWTLNENLAIAHLAVAAISQHAAAGAEWASLWSWSKNAIVFSGAKGLAGALSSTASALSMTSQVFSQYASFERREQDWRFQKEIGQQDVRIGQQQIRLAQDQTLVAAQERAISALQVEHAEAMLDFIKTKFTSQDLYEWMSGVVEQVYRFFLQQATSMAQLAAYQLAFERQEILSTFIKADYWEPPTQGQSPDFTPASAGGQPPNMRGLTGSARLLRDIYELDQYAFRTNQRKLQLTKTISLSQLDPFAFQRFRETGVLPFATSMSIFDRDFPGHYLRLIRRVRTSVIALIPPTLGIRAMLSTTGTSHVVIGHDIFQEVIVQRGPEQVALSSPINATGLFELDSQPELLIPFEGIGVDASWEFRMPKAANLFDYSTIADVLITIEYTALDNFDYRQQVIQGLDRRMSADRAFSFRQHFADAWYDLHNPDQATPPPMTVHFKTMREDFPPNLETLRIKQVVLYFARADGKPFPDPLETSLHFTFTDEQGIVVSVGGTVTTDDLVRSTGRGNATDWISIIGAPVSGEWELAIPNDKTTRDYFETDECADMLLIITYSGRTPEWPA